MRIIDKNTDFYDYLQGIYQDNSITFDRTDSFVLTKDMVSMRLRRGNLREKQDYNFILLQICNTFWLFLLKIIATNDYDNVTDYDMELSASIEDLLIAFLDKNESGTGKYDECTEEIIEDLKDRIGEYLYKQWGISIFRPMVIEYDDESEEYHEYPYPHLVESEEEF